MFDGLPLYWFCTEMYFDYELGFIWLFLNLSRSLGDFFRVPIFFLDKFNVICIGLFELLSRDILWVEKLPMFIAGELRLSSKFGWLRRFPLFLRFLILIFYPLLSYWAGIWGGCKSVQDPELKVKAALDEVWDQIWLGNIILIKNVILEWFISAQTSMPSVLPCWSSMIPSVRKATTWRNFQGTCSLGWVTKYFLEFWH